MILQGKGLIIPDSHEKIDKLKRILALYESTVTWVLFLGDFFDSFFNGGMVSEYTHAMCKWLVDNVANPKYRFLFGNHDIHYAFPWNLRCSGWTPDKQRLIAGYMKAEHWQHFRLLAWILQPEDKTLLGPREWLCSHAGLHQLLMHPYQGYDKDALAEMEQIVLSDLQFGQIGPWLQPGRARGGSQRVGGVDWLDWNLEFTPVAGLNQIVGHTNGAIPRIKQTEDSMNICIDTNLNYVLLVDDGKIEIQQVT